MQKEKVTITGRKVHDVGYRVMLVNKALSLGLDNFNTFNTYINGNQSVIAIIEADEDTIGEFNTFIRSFTPEEAIVDGIDFKEYLNTVPPIERVMQAFQMEQCGKVIPILLKIVEKLDDNTSILKENTSILKENTVLLKSTNTTLTEFKQQTHEDLNNLTNIITKHDIEIKGSIVGLTMEISGVKDRLTRLECARG